MTLLTPLLAFANTHGGPYKLLLLQLRGGQLIGALLALSIYAWLLSIQRSHPPPPDAAVTAIGTLLSVYILALLPGTWYLFERAWFVWVGIAGDVLGIVGAVAVAVVTRGGAGGGTDTCVGPFGADGGRTLGRADVVQGCKLQKVVFATGVTNSIMFFVTLALGVFLKSRWYSAPKGGRGTEKVEQVV